MNNHEEIMPDTTVALTTAANSGLPTHWLKGPIFSQTNKILWPKVPTPTSVARVYRLQEKGLTVACSHAPVEIQSQGFSMCNMHDSRTLLLLGASASLVFPLLCMWFVFCPAERGVFRRGTGDSLGNALPAYHLITEW